MTRRFNDHGFNYILLDRKYLLGLLTGGVNGQIDQYNITPLSNIVGGNHLLPPETIFNGGASFTVCFSSLRSIISPHHHKAHLPPQHLLQHGRHHAPLLRQPCSDGRLLLHHCPLRQPILYRLRRYLFRRNLRFRSCQPSWILLVLHTSSVAEGVAGLIRSSVKD
ncbi:hypothetical protein VNO78_03777 [Psophocarpus tetragonolobus]|uniref:Uncharacterized protein n=1 Tax=Psophocarpus tetragonolobus TaxID=3891 RepID=A0AAN9T1M6_PSOTE